MSKELGLRDTLNALDDIDASTVARAHYEAEKILLRYTNLRVALAYKLAIERAERRQSLTRVTVADETLDRCGP